ncbi:MAG: M28 family peptidase [Chitinophagales bacterium]|nr:M28 family peptidase [Chitinophagales bacterium]
MFLFVLSSCVQESGKKQEPVKSAKTYFADCPEFDKDLAYDLIQMQVDFGPRIPGTEAHRACSDSMIRYLEKYSDRVLVQNDKVETYNGKIFEAKNIIASFNPEAPKRILLCAHYDTRPFADQDPLNPTGTFSGANDGASGTGVLLSIAKSISEHPIELGIDIILFDVEDYGQPENVRKYKPDTYCLGSQSWAKNPHVKNYRAQFGILLDMVGAKNAVFPREGVSMQYAPTITTEIWDVANLLGYSKYFDYSVSKPITDDHLYINKIAGIPTIDIIHLDKHNQFRFGDFWHTHDDNMSIIDKATLTAVGQSVIQVVYNFDSTSSIKPRS